MPLRSMIQAIRLVPEDGELAIELVGELAGILALNKENRPGQEARIRAYRSRASFSRSCELPHR